MTVRTRISELALTFCMERAELLALSVDTRRVVTTVTAFSGAAASAVTFLTTFSGALAASGLAFVRAVLLGATSGF